jgi:hypothetical protein
MNALLGPSKRRKRRVCRVPTPSDIPSDSDTELVVPLADDWTEEVGRQDVDCVLCCTGRCVVLVGVLYWSVCCTGRCVVLVGVLYWSFL